MLIIEHTEVPKEYGQTKTRPHL